MGGSSVSNPGLKVYDGIRADRKQPFVRSPMITPLAVKVEVPVIMISPPFTTLPKRAFQKS